MKKLLYLFLLTPIIYLSSCSKGGITPQEGGITPQDTTQSNLVGTWERSAVGYNYTEQYFYGELAPEDVNGDGEPDWSNLDQSTWVFWGGYHNLDAGGASYITDNSSMALIYGDGYDRYVIEMHLDSTYDAYLYINGIAEHYEGTWLEVSDTLLFLDGQTYTYTKNHEDTYELSLSEELVIPLSHTSYPDDNTMWSNNPDSSPDRLIITDIYEEYIRIE